MLSKLAFKVLGDDFHAFRVYELFSTTFDFTGLWLEFWCFVFLHFLAFKLYAEGFACADN